MRGIFWNGLFASIFMFLAYILVTVVFLKLDPVLSSIGAIWIYVVMFYASSCWYQGRRPFWRSSHVSHSRS